MAHNILPCYHGDDSGMNVSAESESRMDTINVIKIAHTHTNTRECHVVMYFVFYSKKYLCFYDKCLELDLNDDFYYCLLLFMDAFREVPISNVARVQ